MVADPQMLPFRGRRASMRADSSSGSALQRVPPGDDHPTRTPVEGIAFRPPRRFDLSSLLAE
jgi:hypothetical protein